MTSDGTLAAGVVLATRYQVERRLGGGGQGVVYAAQDLRLERRVAIKHGPAGATAAFLAEARALASIDRAYVAAVHDVIAHDGEPVLVMEYVAGLSLDQYLRSRVIAGRAVPVGEALDILIAIAESIAAVHRAGYVHGDLSARNVMLVAGGRVLLIDFGLAAPHDATGQRRGGSPEYVAPEIVCGTSSAAGRSRADLYALGVLGWELMTGGVPFAGGDPRATALMHVVRPLPAISAHRPLPASVEELLRALLAKRPDARPGSVELVLWQLRAIRRELSGTARIDRFRVLVVEDDAAMRSLLNATVQAALPDADVAEAADGAAALHRVAEHPPDLIVLDLSLPDTTGLELCMALRSGERVSSTCAFVAVSGTADHATQQALGAHGVTSFVPKDAALPAALLAVLRDLRASLEYGPPSADLATLGEATGAQTLHDLSGDPR